jgi:glycosyltransferase involved in cell wall biosynthesis
MKSPVLSVCIATYNRAEYIGETLDSLIGQLTEDVEIVVVDGASTDDTPSVMERYAAGCPQLRYVRLPAKGGVDQDFCRAVEQAHGTYCWLFPDDDLFKPGALRRVLDELRNDHSLVIVNADVMNHDFTVRLKPSMLDITADEAYPPDDLEGLFRTIVPAVSFIGSVVIRRDLWLLREHARYLGTEFIHVGVIFQERLPGTAYVIAQPYVSIRYGNAQWRSRSFEIWLKKWPRLIWSFPLITDDAKRIQVRPEPWRKLRTLRRYRALGSYSRETYAKFIAPSDASGLFKLAAFAISKMPQSAWNAWTVWYVERFKHGKDKQLMLYDLSRIERRKAPGSEDGWRDSLAKKR